MAPLGGQPRKGSQPSVADFDYRIKCQRAFEAMLWSVPAVAVYDFRRAAIDTLGAKDNDIAYSRPATPKLETLTANRQGRCPSTTSGTSRTSTTSSASSR